MREPVLDPPLIRDLIESKSDGVIRPELLNNATTIPGITTTHGNCHMSPALLYVRS